MVDTETEKSFAVTHTKPREALLYKATHCISLLTPQVAWLVVTSTRSGEGKVRVHYY
jgi:hypothetical protein